MELKEFLKETISQIGEAIDELNKEDNGICVNPMDEHALKFVTQDDRAYNKTEINFHLDLSINESKTKDGKISVMSALAGIGGGVNKTNQSNANTSIDFSISAVFREGIVDKKLFPG